MSEPEQVFKAMILVPEGWPKAVQTLHVAVAQGVRVEGGVKCLGRLMLDVDWCDSAWAARSDAANRLEHLADALREQAELIRDTT
jgi:hypothetical protein